MILTACFCSSFYPHIADASGETPPILRNHIPWVTHEGTYTVVAVSIDIEGRPAAPSVATLRRLMIGTGSPRQFEPSVRSNLAVIGVHLRTRIEAFRLGSAPGINTATCDTATVTYERTRAIEVDPRIASADALLIFTPYKSACLSGGVTQGHTMEIETPQNGWVDPRMIEHELGHGLLGLSHSGISSTVGANRLNSSTTGQNQYGPDSVMGASTAGWSGPDQLVAGDLHPSQVNTVTTSGTYRIYRRELFGNTTHPALLRIPLQSHTGLYAGNPPEEVILEYEVQIGADSKSQDGANQTIAQTWSEQKMSDQALVPMTWEVGRLTPSRPAFTITLPGDHVTVTEIARTNDWVDLHVQNGPTGNTR